MGKSILCVDDDLDDRYLFCEAMKMVAPGIEVREAENGKEALKILHEAAVHTDLPCMVILDLNMPEMNGRETLEKILSEPTLQLLPVIVLTSSQNPNDQLFLRNRGIQMITKPNNFDLLSHLIKGFIHLCK
ncbi:MAG: response regulator [Flavitalea sp.]